MVAYNFQKQFAERIVDGSKRHTIRRNGKRRHAQRGSDLQLYSGMRTKSCRKVCDDRKCLGVFPIEIEVGAENIELIQINGRTLPYEHYGQFAIEDGFADIWAFHQFWLDFHGQGRFTDASIICWADSLALNLATDSKPVWEWADKLRHMLGAGSDIPRSSHGYRNYYCACIGSDDDRMLQVMAAEGLVTEGVTINNGRDRYYHATLKGCEFINLSKFAIERAFED